MGTLEHKEKAEMSVAPQQKKHLYLFQLSSLAFWLLVSRLDSSFSSRTLLDALGQVLNCSGPHLHLRNTTSLPNFITKWESECNRTLKGCERAYKVVLFLLPSILTTVKYYEKTVEYGDIKLFPHLALSVLAKMIWIKILLREWERKWYPQICNVFILLPFFWPPSQGSHSFGAHYQFSSHVHAQSQFPPGWFMPWYTGHFKFHRAVSWQRRNLPTMLSTWASAVLDAPPRGPSRDSVLSAAGKWGCCGGKYTQAVI